MNAGVKADVSDSSRAGLTMSDDTSKAMGDT